MVLKRCNEYLQKLDLFENDVKMYGTQTKEKVCICIAQFENDVKMYGTQTNLEYFLLLVRLRMM